MNPVKFLAGADAGETLDAVLGRLQRCNAWMPFDARAMQFVVRLSALLLTDARARAFPELLALGHWFRAARLRDLAPQYAREDGAGTRVGRGLAFHLAPANVDSIFMYSWLVSLLAGNANVVRVSGRPSPQVDLLIDVLARSLDEPGAAPLRGRIALLTYEHDETITRSISAAAMVRVIWGGDATIEAIRAIAIRPTAVELAFPDRSSLAALDAAAVLALDDAGLHKLAAAFYNDAFWYSQQACSSPRLVVMAGSPAQAVAARERFWAAVGSEIARRQPEDAGPNAMSRLVTAFEYAAAAAASPVKTAASFPLRLLLDRPLTDAEYAAHCGNGLFLEETVESLPALARHLSDRFQTIAAFGFDSNAIEHFVRALPPRTVDRIVPIGQALDFGLTWDGIDLIEAFTRRIGIRMG